MAKIYVPDEIPDEFCYIGNITDTYFDLYDKSNIQGTSGVTYRVFYGFEPSYYEMRSYNNSSYYTTSYAMIERTSSVFARPDNYKIFSVAFSFIVLVILLINIMTSIIKRGGVLGGLL